MNVYTHIHFSTIYEKQAQLYRYTTDRLDYYSFFKKLTLSACPEVIKTQFGAEDVALAQHAQEPKVAAQDHLWSPEPAMQQRNSKRSKP